MNQGKLSIWVASWAALLAFSVMVSAGCGGDNGESSSAGSQTSSQASIQGGAAESGGGEGGAGGEVKAGENQEEGSEGPLIAEANTICAKSREEYGENVSKYLSLKVNSKEEEEEIYAEIVEVETAPTLEKRIEDIQALSGDSSEEEAIDQVSEGLEAVIDETEADPTAFSEGAIPSAIHARETGKELGLKECGLLG